MPIIFSLSFFLCLVSAQLAFITLECNFIWPFVYIFNHIYKFIMSDFWRKKTKRMKIPLTSSRVISRRYPTNKKSNYLFTIYHDLFITFIHHLREKISNLQAFFFVLPTWWNYHLRNSRDYHLKFFDLNFSWSQLNCWTVYLASE